MNKYMTIRSILRDDDDKISHYSYDILIKKRQKDYMQQDTIIPKTP